MPGLSRGLADVTVPPFKSPLKHVERESTAKRLTPITRRQGPHSHLDLCLDLKAQKCVCHVHCGQGVEERGSSVPLVPPTTERYHPLGTAH